MQYRRASVRRDDTPVRVVTALASAWVDPLEEAFADLQAQQELEELQRRRAPAQAAPPTWREAPATGRA